MKYQVVKIGDKYAVRKKSFFDREFIDLRDTSYCWEPGDKLFYHCLGTEEEARKVAKLKSFDLDCVVVDEYPKKKCKKQI